jgi:tetratricopeptide (TPR) repeat protein
MRVRLFSLLLLSAGGVLFAGCSSDEEALADHYDRGEEYREAEQLDEAIIEFKNVLQIDPNHADAHYGLAQAFLKQGKAREGFWELRETVRLDPANHIAAVQFAQISIYAGEIEEALKRVDAVLAEAPDDEKAWMVKGQAHEALKEPEETLKAFEKAVEVAPESDTAMLVLANYHRRNGDRVMAGPIFERAAKSVPSMRTKVSLASFYAEDRGRDAEAEAAYREGLELAEPSEQARAYTLLGSFLLGRDRVDESIAVIEEGIETVEDPLDLIYALARVYQSRGNEEKADELIQRATEAAPDEARPFLVLSSYRGRQGDLPAALAAADRAVELDPDDDAARLRKAEVLIEIGFREDEPEKVTEGRALVERVLSDEPSHPGGLFVKAKLSLAANEFEEAIQALRSAIDVRPDWAEAHFLLGTALRLTGQRSVARTELARALEIDASLVDARRILAEVHADLGEHEYAVEEGRRFLAQRPEAHETRIRVAQSLIYLRRLDEALSEVEAIPEEDRDGKVKFALGRIYSATGDYEKSHELLLAALEELPEHPEILSALLQVEKQMGKEAVGLARIEAAVIADPNNAKLQQLAAAAAISRGDVDEGIEALNRAIELDPDDPSGYRRLAELYVRTGRTKQTIETYEKALERNPKQPNIHHFLGVLYEFGGQRKRAITHYEEAIKYSPDLAESKNNLAYLYAEEGEQLDRALDLAQDAKALLPDDPNAADTLGWVLYRRGVPSAAIGYLKEAEAGMPDDYNLGLVRHHLAMAYEASGDKVSARDTLDRAIEAHSAFVEAQKARGVPVGADPAWLGEARSLRERL